MNESIRQDPLNATGVQFRIERIRTSSGTPTPRCDASVGCERDARFSCEIPKKAVAYRCDDHHPILL